MSKATTPPTARVDYSTYMASDEWKAKRSAAFSRARRASRDGLYAICEACGRHGTMHKNRAEGRDHLYRVDGTNGLQVHHVHYRNLGREEPNDLIVLCTDRLFVDAPDFRRGLGCHERVHDDQSYRSEVARIAAARSYR